MNAKKILKKMIKEHESGNEVTFISDYKKIKEVAKLLISQPETFIQNISIENEDSCYNKAFILTYDTDNAVWCQKAFLDDGHIALSSGVCFIDVNAIGNNKPSDFVNKDDSYIKIIGGEIDDTI